MKQSELRLLCREYTAGSISDAQLIRALQVGEDIREMLMGVCALPKTAQMRVRIEDLLPVVPQPGKVAGKAKTEEPTYMKRLRNFVDDHYDEEEDMLPWTSPEITTGTAVNGHDKYYRFSFKTKSLANAFYRVLRSQQTTKVDSERVKFDEANKVVTAYTPELDKVNLIPPAEEVTEVF